MVSDLRSIANGSNHRSRWLPSMTLSNAPGRVKLVVPTMDRTNASGLSYQQYETRKDSNHPLTWTPRLLIKAATSAKALVATASTHAT